MPVVEVPVAIQEETPAEETRAATPEAETPVEEREMKT